MAEAAAEATAACMEKGYSRSDPVTVLSARRAAEEVMRANQDEAVVPEPRADGWDRRRDLD